MDEASNTFFFGSDPPESTPNPSDEARDLFTDTTDGQLAGVRAGANSLLGIQREMNRLLADARLYSGSTNVLDQARAVQIERTLQSLRNERALVEMGNLGPDYRSITAWQGLFGAAASSSSSSSWQPTLPAGATSGGGSFMGTAASTPAGSVGTITGATPGGASASALGQVPQQITTPGIFGAAQPVAGIDWNWRPSWMATDSTTEQVEEVD